MKILCFFPLLRRADSELVFSGGERRFIEICKEWVKLGNEVHVIGSEYVSRLFKMFGLRTHIHFYNPSLNPPVIVDFSNSIKISRKIPGNRFDFIYCPSEQFSYLVPSVMAKNKLKVPLVVSINLLDPGEIKVFTFFKMILNLDHSKFFLRKLGGILLLTYETYVRNLLLKKADLIFSVSKYTKKLLMKMRIDNKRIFPVAGGIHYDYIQTIRSQKKIYHACYMGAIHPRKGVFDLVKLWKEIIKKESNAKLLILGEGDKGYVDKFKESIKKHNLQDNITILGFKTGEEKYKLLKQSEIFIFPSYSDLFAGAICEAMACGLPVVAYDLPAYHDFYNNDIVYIHKGDITGLIEATSVLLEDDELKNKLKERGLRRSQNYNWTEIAKNEMEIVTQHLKINV